MFVVFFVYVFFFQAEDGIRDLVRSRGLGDVYKRQVVSIVLDADDNPYLVFESLNAKGRPLTQADLIRNYLSLIHI